MQPTHTTEPLSWQLLERTDNMPILSSVVWLSIILYTALWFAGLIAIVFITYWFMYWRASKEDGFVLCEECLTNPADYPSKICVGCEAYSDHNN